MKLKDEFVKLPKYEAYDMYEKIVYNVKDYDDITRSKMLNEILKQYELENYMYHICTTRELEFLSQFQNKKLKPNEIKKYKWEIETLNRKGIFSATTYAIFEEQKENVKRTITEYQKNKIRKEKNDDLILLIIGVVRTNAEILVKALNSMISGIYNIDSKDLDRLYGNPLIHFYCSFKYEYVESLKSEEEVIYYRDYWFMLDVLFTARKEFGIAGSMQVDIRDYYDMFYYGYPIKKESVQKMLSMMKRGMLSVFETTIERARVLNYREPLNLMLNGKLLKIVYDALDDTPCAAMNGFTPNEYQKERNKEEIIMQEFPRIPQNNARLCKNAADEFYKLYFAVLDYTNKKYNINPDIRKIYKQEGLDVRDLSPINDYLWKNKSIIDEFISLNPNNMTKEELDIISGFKSAVTSDKFVITGFEREYTEFLSDDGKIYMVKGIRSNFDELIAKEDIPVIVSTTLLMFKDNIVYNSFFSHIDIKFGNDVKEYILEEYNKAMKYYHL